MIDGLVITAIGVGIILLIGYIGVKFNSEVANHADLKKNQSKSKEWV